MYMLAKFNTFQGLENRFWNSILFQYRVGTLIVTLHLTGTW